MEGPLPGEPPMRGAGALSLSVYGRASPATIGQPGEPGCIGPVGVLILFFKIQRSRQESF